MHTITQPSFLHFLVTFIGSIGDVRRVHSSSSRPSAPVASYFSFPPRSCSHTSTSKHRLLYSSTTRTHPYHELTTIPFRDCVNTFSLPLYQLEPPYFRQLPAFVRENPNNKSKDHPQTSLIGTTFHPCRAHLLIIINKGAFESQAFLVRLRIDHVAYHLSPQPVQMGRSIDQESARPIMAPSVGHLPPRSIF